MLSAATLFDKPRLCGRIDLREYQKTAHDESLRIMKDGVAGVLIRAATGLGKTLMACSLADTWLTRGDDYRVMIVSYETQLVWQFAQEVQDYLGIQSGIEMDDQKVSEDSIPQVTVVSRQSLLRRKPPTLEQITSMANHGFADAAILNAAGEQRVKKYLKHLENDPGNTDPIYEDLEIVRESPEVYDGAWSRLHKFDWRKNWLVIFDEAHRHTHKMVSVGHIVDWFDQNSNSRRMGMTATPKRGDGVSIGDKMFPGIALDYPLYSPRRSCAVKDGWAVPYVQKYIEVEGVDFANIKRMSGGDFDEAALQHALMIEGSLARMIEPLLDMVGDRKTLIFSPGVDMAKAVAAYINARSEIKCSACGAVKWHPRILIGDGAACACGKLAEVIEISKHSDQARQLDGTSAPQLRREVYKGHQDGDYQFLSVCGLCREGYNDPDIACVAVFRPVSKKASSLAEQMKGRSCRPCRAIARLLGNLPDAEARRKMIAESGKPNALIVDLVGITGLADCASTVEIYSEGLSDEVKQLVEEMLVEEGVDAEIDVQEAIAQVEAKIAADKEAARLEREEAERKRKEEAERRSKANAQVKYTEHDRGYGAQGNHNDPSEKQLNRIKFWGIIVKKNINKRQAGRIIDMLNQHLPPSQVAHENGLKEGEWEPNKPTFNQWNCLQKNGINASAVNSVREASLLISALKEPQKFKTEMIGYLNSADSWEQLQAVRGELQHVWSKLSPSLKEEIGNAGKRRLQQLSGCSDA